MYFTQPEAQNFQVDLGARVVDEEIIVDLYAGFGPMPSEFVACDNALLPALKTEFGERVSEIEVSNRIP